MSIYNSNVKYTKFEDDNEDSNIESMYLSVDEEKQPFLNNHQQYLRESKKLSNLELGEDHFKESWRFAQLSNNEMENKHNTETTHMPRYLFIDDTEQLNENLLNENLKYCTNTHKKNIAKWTKYGCNLVAITSSIVLIVTLFVILGERKI